MASVTWAELLKETFDGMKVAGPKPLLKRLAMAADEHGLNDDPATLLKSAAPDKASAVREALHNQLSVWDYALNPSWAKTAPNTSERRQEIYKLLQLPDDLRKAFDKDIAAKTDEVERELVITDHATTWYTDDFLRDREFYWPKYREYLKNKKGMTDEVLIGLNESANRVLESLAAPTTPTPEPRRGLVVGYVQSGKTTNFTAVIAKAIDAGYRLIIVLAGTIDLLRLQTQRRLDMELVGLENIGVNEDDPDREYQNDPSFPSKFISYGALPRALNEYAPNIKRLTSSTGDFRSIDASFKALAFDELPPREKAYSPSALKKTNARLIVIKKVTPRLKKLVREIKNNKDVRLDLPTLIIDDESDQASVNTVNPDKALAEERSRTNESIVELLKLLPRAQYVGYTATPFANVLVDPNDAEDIYPRDFIISLPRPGGYMGVSDFHDLNRTDEQTPNKDAFVRFFGGDEDERDEDASINAALDAFVVSGALKRFRQSKKVTGDFRHHTMMIHETVKNAEQFVRQASVLKLWKSAGYGSTGKGPDRLRKALEEFRLVSKSREPKLPFPRDYDELKPFVAEALKLIGDEQPVIVVNGDIVGGGTDPSFDTSDHVWKVIIGGAKLSRGFTVEGLTVTWFKRRAKSQDTIMQMGRWFGYRGGYRDLVRLYLERGNDNAYDLYDSFEAICRDEESFRAQLTRYARPANGQKPIRPIQVPAVVYNSFPGIMPTSKNKMFNAKLVEAVVSDEWSSPTDVSMNETDLRNNWNALESLVGGDLEEVKFGKGQYLTKRVGRDELSRFLASLRWNEGRPILAAEQSFFRANPAAAKEWLLVFPQLQERSVKLGKNPISVHERSRRNEAFNVFSSPKHISEVEAEFAKGRPLHGLGVALIYPTHEKPKHTHKHPIVGLALYHPAVPASVAQAVFTVREPKLKDKPVVEAGR
ncbi:MAG: Z1 domain-containing protein [Myxococcaceae bacterium]|nr:Z1 domain-containing protein [Myxococcaceae bacterium]